MKQITFASIAYTHKKVTTKREAFLNEMERVVPWSRLLKLIEPYYPKAGNGRPPMPMETMLRIYFLQQWYSLSDQAAEEALYLNSAIPHFRSKLRVISIYLSKYTRCSSIFSAVNRDEKC